MIKKYELNSIITMKFVESNLNDVNCLSTSILQILYQKKGVFFTYLPEGLTESQVHDFVSGGKTKSMRNNISQILNNYLDYKEMMVIFDDVNTLPKDLNKEFTDNSNIIYHDKEVYYLIEDKSSSKEILKYLNYSSAIWHSLGVISKKNDQLAGKTHFNKNDFELFSNNSVLFLLEAYDGESYVFWERVSE